MKIVRANIRALRVIRRMDQGELADKLDISRQALSAIENDRTSSMSFEMMAKVMEIFKLKSFDDLFELVEVEEESLSEENTPLPETA